MNNDLHPLTSSIYKYLMQNTYVGTTDTTVEVDELDKIIVGWLEERIKDKEGYFDLQQLLSLPPPKPDLENVIAGLISTDCNWSHKHPEDSLPTARQILDYLRKEGMLKEIE